MASLATKLIQATGPAVGKAIRMSSTAATGGSLAGKVAIVTASTEGIGLAIAQKLGREGAAVVISSRKQKNVDKAVEQLKKENVKVTGLVCHVAKKDHRQKLIDHTLSEFGGIDVLVSNAAVNPTFEPILECTEDVWDKIFDVNVKSTFFLCKEVIPHMEKRGKGSLIMVASIGGYVPFELLGPYSISKTAMLGMVKAMAPQCAGKNIRVNGIAPGLIRTKFSSALWQTPEIEQKASEHIPMQRLGRPEECAGAVAFLASDDASYITGETIVMSGGSNSRL